MSFTANHARLISQTSKQNGGLSRGQIIDRIREQASSEDQKEYIELENNISTEHRAHFTSVGFTVKDNIISWEESISSDE